MTADGEEICYGIALNSYDKIKKKSHLFTDATSFLFDEFQSEKFKYLPREIEALNSIYMSIARGAGQMYRYMPVYMLSNHITLLNPYYMSLGITNLHRKTKYLKGDGWVLEQLFNEEALSVAKNNPFLNAFSNSDYSNMQKQGVYLCDDNRFLSKPNGKNSYLCTLIYENTEYSVKKYLETGKYHVEKGSDKSYPVRYIIDKKSVSSNSSFINSSPFMVKLLRDSFQNGEVTFSDLKAKECLMYAISY